MNKLSLEFIGERRKNIDREINYFLKGNKEERFNPHSALQIETRIRYSEDKSKKSE